MPDSQIIEPNTKSVNNELDIEELLAIQSKMKSINIKSKIITSSARKRKNLCNSISKKIGELNARISDKQADS